MDRKLGSSSHIFEPLLIRSDKFHMIALDYCDVPNAKVHVLDPRHSTLNMASDGIADLIRRLVEVTSYLSISDTFVQ
jgi:hypothetical protein